MKPNESLLKAHMEGAPFLAGADAGKWGLHGTLETVDLSHPVFWVRGDKRFVPDERVYLRFDTTGYSQEAPTAGPWDAAGNCRLPVPRWPRGDGISVVFNPAWKQDALYSPCDRMAMQGHDTWRGMCPQWWWQPTFTIVRYLEFVYACVNPAEHEN
ncbi:MAG TPA: hypothetical protein VN578_09640 [Candidatus Binatia bacterium]|jgi:hypothetical protein|nr:hypothetical protein [Candidatus Binatia bacterium]